MIAGKTWRELWKLALVYMLVMEAMLIPPILLWPELYEDLKKLDILAAIGGKVFPLLIDALRKGTEVIAFKWFSAVEIYFRGVNICGVAAAVLFGTGIISRERETQTLEFLLARPISRSRILWSKFWVGAVLLVIPIFLTSWTAPWLSTQIGHELSYEALTIASLHSSVFVVGIFSLTCLFSVVSSSQLGAAASIGTIVVIQAAIYFVQTLRVGSLFQLSDYEVYGKIVNQQLDFTDVFFGQTVWLLLGTALFYFLADWQFRKSEL